MPFVTESLYGHLVHEDESIMISSWPMPQDALIFPQEEQAMISLMDAIREIRNVRSGFGVPPSRKAGLILVSKDPAVRRHFIDGQAFLQRLAAVSTLETRENKAGIPLTAVTALFSGGELYLPLEDLIDLDKEIERLLKEKANLESELTRVSAKLQNQAFMDKAPEKVIQAERDKFSRYSEMHKNASERLILLQESGQAAESVI
ncbi:MAG: class I tRNA ligase family protein, partial [Clostridiaceae bacterium]|nr:class I tRNA ligase family protein [Clostridiaceae bacterium]